MRRLVLGGICMLLVAATLLAATGAQILLEARDLKNQPLAGIRFSFQGVKSARTNKQGATELDLPPKQQTGQKITIQIVQGSQKADDWFLVNPEVNIPNESASAAVVLMRRSEFRRFAAAARDATSPEVLRQGELTAADRRRVLVDTAGRYGLTAEQLETALRSFAETQDPKDKGIAAYLEGQYSQAEDLLNKAAEKKESDLVDTLGYLGAAQYEQGKFRASAETFRKALALRGEDTAILSRLSASLLELADWTEAEPLMRRALAIDEKNFGPEHHNVAADLNNLAQLLQATNRLAEAEPLMRRALAIEEKVLGPENPEVATDLNNLGQLFVAMNRHEEAEPLLRQSLDITEKNFGLEHPRVATSLNNLALLLWATSRLAEAEPLIRRAIAIDEKSLAPEHPLFATHLSSLASLLEATNRLAEAETLRRQTLAIAERSLGPDHPTVANRLNNLASLLQDLKRFSEAEPLLRRAIAITERSLGPENPNIAIYLNNLASLLKAIDRMAEAEPLMHRALAILLEFQRRNGHQHPAHAKLFENYRKLLVALGKSDVEIQAAIEALEKASQAKSQYPPTEPKDK